MEPGDPLGGASRGCLVRDLALPQDPKGPSTNIRRTPGFYRGNYILWFWPSTPSLWTLTLRESRLAHLGVRGTYN